MACFCQVSSSQERGRWGQPIKPGAQERPKWEEGGKVVLSDLSLEETASNMEGKFTGVNRNTIWEEKWRNFIRKCNEICSECVIMNG